MAKTKCTHCGELVEVINNITEYHDFPKPCRQICRGSKKWVSDPSAIIDDETN
jgi:hypothetical protein